METVLIYLLPLVAVALTVWVYRDAKEQEGMNPFVWAFITGFGWGLGVVAYLWAKREREG